MNHDVNSRSRSRSTAASASSDLMWRNRSARSATISAVAPGARFKRRKNSSRGLYDAFCSPAECLVRRMIEIVARRLGNCEGIRLHLIGKKAVKLQPLLARRLLQLDEQLTRDRNTGGFATPRHQRARQHLDRTRRRWRRKALWAAAPCPARQRNSSVLAETKRSRADPLQARRSRRR